MLKFPNRKLLLVWFILITGIYFLLTFLLKVDELKIPLLLFIIFSSIVMLILYLSKVIYNRFSQIEKKNLTHYYQTEALLTINKLADLQVPIATSRGWAASPDFIKIVFEFVLKHKPNTIMELGSGISTLYTGNLIKSKNLDTNIISLDHELTFAEISQANCKTHGIDDIAKVYHTPIKKYDINNKEWLWYDFDNINIKEHSIGFLVVDGPPTFLQKQSRYPAIPLLLKYLENDAIIVVDDYTRDDDKAVIKRWCAEFNELVLVREFLDTDKGTAVLAVKRS